ncbi:MAG: hypothetical protein OXU27_03175 [Candidatus Poribacteria bacterium]|nr:hypothetical protein [Candidatus Poribacteria bacterium]
MECRERNGGVARRHKVEARSAGERSRDLGMRGRGARWRVALCDFFCLRARNVPSQNRPAPARQPLSLRSTEARLPERLPKAHPQSGETETERWTHGTSHL